MATKWKSLQEVRKGDIGEQLVNKWLKKQGFVPYVPDADQAHPFDRLVATPDKKQIFVAEIKTKPSRIYYPDTGINLTHYRDYKNVTEKYGIGVHLFFVDERLRTVYGNWLQELDQPRVVMVNGKPKHYPSREQDRFSTKIYFPLEAMHHIADIPVSIVEKLKSLTQNSYGDAAYG